MSVEMVCNFRKCRKPLINQAWVTTCSHAFCVEHGKREFKTDPATNALTCPACGTELRDKFDVIQADLKPGDTFRSIVLAGMKPDTIMDVAMRAISFWSYQIEQETLYQENMAKHAREKIQSFQEGNELNLKKLMVELDTCKRRITNLQEQYLKKRKQTEELNARLEEKNRKVQKLTLELEAMKRKSLNYNAPKNQEKCMDISDLVRAKSRSDAFIFKPTKENEESQAHAVCSPKTPMFDFGNRNRHQSHFQFRPMK